MPLSLNIPTNMTESIQGKLNESQVSALITSATGAFITAILLWRADISRWQRLS